MISSVSGELRHVGEDRVRLACGPVVLEVLVPAADVPMLEGLLGQPRTFHTMALLEGDPSGGNMQPRLLGFHSEADRAFFGLFVTVKGIGPRKALRALTVPAAEVAAAIEAKDTRALVKLPQVGKRLAETIVAELAGKVGRFAAEPRDAAAARPSPARRDPIEEDAIATLMALGERRGEAEKLLESAKAAGAAPASVDALIKAMLNARQRRG